MKKRTKTEAQQRARRLVAMFAVSPECVMHHGPSPATVVVDGVEHPNAFTDEDRAVVAQALAMAEGKPGLRGVSDAWDFGVAHGLRGQLLSELAISLCDLHGDPVAAMKALRTWPEDDYDASKHSE